ncbi:YdcF family protein [Neisseria iguanae]|uniref:DUF218 domain-containing protein n=1 Tax=Neisseria iguanae TaxID=90242 RepID=A0A2P7TYQ1_9NEIS|nr:YdcF family protein [Neisseria iguanae]PSJ79825.1 hypothetical protein C7N83_09880 [Neisseria iguanae]
MYRAGKADYLPVSGSTDADGSKQAKAMRKMAVKLGVPSEKVWLENQSQNTHQNIKFNILLL